MKAASARLDADSRGTVLIEFAISLPILVLLFVGGFQISDAVFAYRKVTATARTVADLTSRNTDVTDVDLDVILNASKHILSPYALSNARLVVSQVTIDGSGNATVAWSRPLNTVAYPVNSSFYVPAAYRQNDTTIIVADVAYDYVPVFASALLGRFTLRDQIAMYPRKSTTIRKSS